MSELDNYGTRGSEAAADAAQAAGECAQHRCPRCGVLVGMLPQHLRACDGGAVDP